MFPGLPIYSSPDLSNWTHISNALSRTSQIASPRLSLRKSSTKIWPKDAWGEVGVGTGGLYAPTLRFHDGTFYIACTNIINNEDITASDGDETQNFILTTKDIEGEWSDPIFYDNPAIDPSLFWDTDSTGKVRSYAQGSASPGPATKINIFEIDLTTGKRLSEPKVIWEGIVKIWPEGPHIYKKDGYYYLMIAEGGTFREHMIEMARSRNLEGPYEEFEGNPILPPASREERVQCTGHGDLFMDKEGRCWCVCLGTKMMRGSKGKRYIMGRETYLTAVEWEEGGWPRILPVKENLEGTGREGLLKKGTGKIEVRGMVDFLFIRDPVMENYEILDKGRKIKMTAGVGDLQQHKEATSFVGKRQRMLEGTSSVEMQVPDKNSNVKAGLAVYKDEHRFARVFYVANEGKVVFEMLNAAKEITRTESKTVESSKTMTLKIKYTEGAYEIFYSSDAEEVSIATVDTADMSNIDFVGPVIGVFAVDDGKGAVVQFDNLTVD